MAQDTGGVPVAKPFYDAAKATFTALVDVNHTVSSLYDMVNVPTAVWIDETGKIVRHDEDAQGATHLLHALNEMRPADAATTTTTRRATASLPAPLAWRCRR